MKPLVIFDMDGVLIDSEPIHTRVEQEIFRSLGLTVSAEAHNRFVGMSPHGMWSAIRERYGLEQPVAGLVAMDIRAKVRAFARTTLSPATGVEGLIRSIAGAGYGLAIASSSSRILIDIIVAALGFDEYFPHRVSTEEVRDGKPAPDIFLAAAQRCNRPASHCVVIEDSHNGVRASLAAGMTCIGYRNRSSGDQDLSDADLVVDSFDDAGIRRIMETVRRKEFAFD